MLHSIIHCARQDENLTIMAKKIHPDSNCLVSGMRQAIAIV